MNVSIPIPPAVRERVCVVCQADNLARAVAGLRDQLYVARQQAAQIAPLLCKGVIDPTDIAVFCLAPILSVLLYSYDPAHDGLLPERAERFSDPFDGDVIPGFGLRVEGWPCYALVENRLIQTPRHDVPTLYHSPILPVDYWRGRASEAGWDRTLFVDTARYTIWPRQIGAQIVTENFDPITPDHYAQIVVFLRQHIDTGQAHFVTRS